MPNEEWVAHRSAKVSTEPPAAIGMVYFWPCGSETRQFGFAGKVGRNFTVSLNLLDKQPSSFPREDSPKYASGDGRLVIALVNTKKVPESDRAFARYLAELPRKAQDPTWIPDPNHAISELGQPLEALALAKKLAFFFIELPVSRHDFRWIPYQNMGGGYFEEFGYQYIHRSQVFAGKDEVAHAHVWFAHRNGSALYRMADWGSSWARGDRNALYF